MLEIIGRGREWLAGNVAQMRLRCAHKLRSHASDFTRKWQMEGQTGSALVAATEKSLVQICHLSCYCCCWHKRTSFGQAISFAGQQLEAMRKEEESGRRRGFLLPLPPASSRHILTLSSFHLSLCPAIVRVEKR